MCKVCFCNSIHIHEKMGGKIFPGKKNQTRGAGSEGGLAKDQNMAGFFSWHPFLTLITDAEVLIMSDKC